MSGDDLKPCGRELLVDSPPCPLIAGHWPPVPHRAHSPYGNGQWVDYAEDDDGNLVRVAESLTVTTFDKRSAIRGPRAERAAADRPPEPRPLDDLARLLHDAYEAAAPHYGWQTQAASAVPWEDVPESNRATVREAVAVLLDELGVEYQVRLGDRGTLRCEHPELATIPAKPTDEELAASYDEMAKDRKARRDPGVLTAAEHRAIAILGEFADLMVNEIIGEGPSCASDIAETVNQVHHLQHAVMAQAAARAYPDRYRLLGEVIP